MKKLLFLTVFFPSISWGACSSFTYTISEKPTGYSGVRYYVCDTDIDKPSSGLTMGEKAFIKDSGLVYFATSTTGWVPQVSITTEVTNVRNLKWSDNSFLSTTSIANYALLTNSLNISSITSSYLGVSSAATIPTYFSVSLSTGVTGNLSVNNLNNGSGATSLTFWKGDGSWGVPLGGFLDGLTLSSASVSYQGISSTPWTSTMLPLSSSSTFQDKASGATTYLTIGSSGTFNQALTQLSSFTAFGSSMPVSYVGISSLTIANGVMTVASQTASNVVNQGQYMFQSSQAASNVVNQGQYVFRSSEAVSYVGISSLTAANQVLTLSSAAASYLAISTVGATNSIYSPYGTGYSLTATTATLNIAGSSATITIGTPGTYLLMADTNITYEAATFAATQVMTFALYRQNNTPGVIANSLIQGRTRVITAITDDAGYYSTPLLIYVTANSNDQLSWHGSITAIPSAGSIQARKSSFLAIRLH